MTKTKGIECSHNFNVIKRVNMGSWQLVLKYHARPNVQGMGKIQG